MLGMFNAVLEHVRRGRFMLLPLRPEERQQIAAVEQLLQVEQRFLQNLDEENRQVRDAINAFDLNPGMGFRAIQNQIFEEAAEAIRVQNEVQYEIQLNYLR